MQKLHAVRIALSKWATKTRFKRNRRKRELEEKLLSLVDMDRAKENLVELIDTKIHLNLEIDKDKMYWE